jgi:hypothetical protein
MVSTPALSLLIARLRKLEYRKDVKLYLPKHGDVLFQRLILQSTGVDQTEPNVVGGSMTNPTTGCVRRWMCYNPLNYTTPQSVRATACNLITISHIENSVDCGRDYMSPSQEVKDNEKSTTIRVSLYNLTISINWELVDTRNVLDIVHDSKEMFIATVHHNEENTDPVCGFYKTDDGSGAIRFVHTFMHNGQRLYHGNVDLYPYRTIGNSDGKSIAFVNDKPQYTTPNTRWDEEFLMFVVAEYNKYVDVYNTVMYIETEGMEMYIQPLDLMLNIVEEDALLVTICTAFEINYNGFRSTVYKRVQESSEYKRVQASSEYKRVQESSEYDNWHTVPSTTEHVEIMDKDAKCLEYTRDILKRAITARNLSSWGGIICTQYLIPMLQACIWL